MRKTGLGLLGIGILFIGCNLRAPIVAVGPLEVFIRQDLNLSGSVMGFLTTLPLLAFAAFSLLVPSLAPRWGNRRLMFYGLLLLLGGEILRPFGGAFGLFIGTLAIGCGAAIGNVLLPSMIKDDFPQQVGLLTGLYTATMAVFSGIAAGISVPLAVNGGLGWQGSLSIWWVLTLVVACIWLPQLRQPERKKQGKSGSLHLLLRTPLVWHVTFFMGLQSFFFYTMVAWLPAILQSKGLNPEQAGYLTFFFQTIAIPASLAVAAFADRMKDQKILVYATCIFYFLGLSGLLLLPRSVGLVCSVGALGLASGAAISLALTCIGLRSANSRDAAAVSGLSQAVGYLLAAVSPVLFGALNDWTGSWTLPLCLLFLPVVAWFYTGRYAGGAGIIGKIGQHEGDAA